MKKLIIAVSICILIACSALTMTVAASGPAIRLPGDAVEMRAEYDTDSWFSITVSNVPSDDYDVKNETYNGWCVQKSINMTFNVNHQVILKSSYDEDLNGFEQIPWHEINYIINHRTGYNRDSVQWAIWHYTDGKDVSALPASQALVDAADQNGTNFVPQSGQILAIPMIGISTIQLAFFELIVPPPSLQGLVWYDTNADGIQNGEPGEPGLGSVTVRLYNSSDVLIEETQTNPEGIYSFGSQKSGDYYLKFISPPSYKFTIKDAGTDDTLDSDADTSTGTTIIFNIPANQTVSITNWAAGMYKKSSGGTPAPPEEEPVTNKRPTADGTAGEPYRGIINMSITFNGSRSYDLDGRIISWRWIFGDETNGTGEVTTHIYTHPGSYNVSLLVMDDDFATDMYTTTATITTGNSPPAAPVIAGPRQGFTTVMYHYTVVAIDPDGDNLKYFIDWGDDTQNISTIIGNGVTLELSHQWAAPGFYNIQAYANDTYDENSDITQITVAIDVSYVQNLGYLIDVNNDGIYEKFHSNETGVETTVRHQTDGTYLLDTNGDGQWNIAYDPVSRKTQDYHDQPILQYALIILVILIIAFLVIYYIMRNRRRS